ncbi:TetR/AcrR family transcriptional regulator [Frankia sp. CNm7]|uniref:TetR/AcrR family transcriptional regulator n=1 Tax=Frankia nepalensis TaxID=1836974 RepID=A0A937UUT9_9ACTN|nr:TetR/AcrR family transcriptional regulator [Frankia nepalensis]MBL7499388.1 TetR/AcrR family transcriptional regulator [Frankia nepalensis]MBL7512797.1 TetR/AcrR family transcriptional regulator [Frankia nepalensis]MBL7521782.1 TetR/AcrR family transcriptional regulator [Frankia nepalensis]MBL7631531.1 TetR/AcrR family transcriptional regulator [Frankia nepalensis]
MVTDGRGTITRTPRPRDRRTQILLAASALFYQSGYPNVGTEEIAGRVGITAGALYRHFRSKEELLARALSDSFDRAAVVAGRGGADLGDVVADLAAISAQRRELGVLWTRESRYLSETLRTPMRERFFHFHARLVDAVNADRPELGRRHAEVLAWCTLGVLTSPSYHDVSLPSEEAAASLLTRLALAVCRTPVPTARVPAGEAAPGTRRPVVRPLAPAEGAAPGLPRGTRREALVVAAARLFGERGYQGVTTEEIGAAVGVSSAAVYRHFATKADLLVTIVVRASSAMLLAMSSSLDSASTPEAGLAHAAGTYIDFAMSHPDLVGVLVTEMHSLPEEYRRRVHATTRTYVAEWLRLLRAARPGLDRPDALYRVHAVLTMVNDVARTPRLRAVPELAAVLHTACLHALDVSAPTP